MFAPLPVWEPLERFEAKCIDLRHPCSGGSVPSRDHRCGIYAVDCEGAALEWAGHIEHRSFVIGEVWAWGTVAEHESGWRSRYAYPAAFGGAWTRGERDEGLLEELREAYAV
jgi:hypothetical protein